MPPRERLRDRGARKAKEDIATLGRELRDARRGLGLRQSDVAAAADVTRGWVSKVELGEAPGIGVRMLAIMLAVVGLDLRLRAYPGATPFRDEGHRALLGRLRALLPIGAPWRTEVPLPITGDQRAWDALTQLWGRRVGLEAEMRPSDLQALERKLALKLRDGGAERLILLLADTKANRRFVRLAGDDLKLLFGLQGRDAVKALRSPDDPGCNLLVLA
jgi:transcriptional regulator with XRE-family HTH domain